MKKSITLGLALLALGMGGLASGAETTVDAKIQQTILTQLRQARDDLNYTAVTASPIPGIYQVNVDQGPVLYVSADGKHFIAGDLYKVEPGEFVNLQEAQRAAERVQQLAKIPLSDQIVFAPAGKPKSSVTVFTDIDCGYCRKLHKEVPALNAMGIEVRYMAYPRAGVPSKSYNKIATAWCAKDPKDTLTRMKNGEQMPLNVCAGNPVAKQFALGNEVGVRGTPAIITPDGTLLPGYLPAAQLAAALGVK